MTAVAFTGCKEKEEPKVEAPAVIDPIIERTPINESTVLDFTGEEPKYYSAPFASKATLVVVSQDQRTVTFKRGQDTHTYRVPDGYPVWKFVYDKEIGIVWIATLKGSKCGQIVIPMNPADNGKKVRVTTYYTKEWVWNHPQGHIRFR